MQQCIISAVWQCIVLAEQSADVGMPSVSAFRRCWYAVCVNSPQTVECRVCVSIVNSPQMLLCGVCLQSAGDGMPCVCYQTADIGMPTVHQQSAVAGMPCVCQQSADVDMPPYIGLFIVASSVAAMVAAKTTSCPCCNHPKQTAVIVCTGQQGDSLVRTMLQ